MSVTLPERDPAEVARQAGMKDITTFLRSRSKQFQATTLLLQRRDGGAGPGRMYSLDQHVPPGDYDLCRLHPVYRIGPIYLRFRDAHIDHLVGGPTPVQPNDVSIPVVMVTGLASLRVDDLDVMRFDFQVHISSAMQAMTRIIFRYECANFDVLGNTIHISCICPMLEVHTTAITLTSAWGASAGMDASAVPVAKVTAHYSNEKQTTVSLVNWSTAAHISADRRSAEWTLTWNNVGKPQSGEQLGLTIPFYVLCQLPSSLPGPNDFRFPGHAGPGYIEIPNSLAPKAIENLSASVFCTVPRASTAVHQFNHPNDIPRITVEVSNDLYRKHYGLLPVGKPFYHFRRWHLNPVPVAPMPVAPVAVAPVPVIAP